jgi:hypothetical protein
VIYSRLPSYRPLSSEVPVAVQMTSPESVSRKISRKSDEEIELERLVRNVRVEVDIVAVLDRIVNSVSRFNRIRDFAASNLFKIVAWKAHYGLRTRSSSSSLAVTKI